MVTKPGRHSLLAAGLTAAIGLTAACSSSGGNASSASPSSSASQLGNDVKGTARVLMEGVPDTDIVKGLLPAFNKEYPNVNVQIQSIVYDQIKDKVVASFQAPSPTYDLAIIDNPWMGDFAKAGFLQPLDARIAATPGYDYKDFAKPLRDIGTVGNKVYGIPFYNYGLVSRVGDDFTVVG